MPQKRGKILVIEGTDYSGKETQTKLLLEKFMNGGIPCETISFPRYHTPTGRIIGQCYLGKKGLGRGDVAWFGDADKVHPIIPSLYFADDRFAAVSEIEKIIESGKHLIVDRWVESNMAHQGGKEEDSQKRNKIIEFVHNLEYNLLGLPKPDLVIFLYMPYQVSTKLRTKRKEKADGHERNQRHLKNAEETYLQLADSYNWKKINCAPDGTINSLRTPENIHEEVYQCIMKTFPKI